MRSTECTRLAPRFPLEKNEEGGSFFDLKCLKRNTPRVLNATKATMEPTITAPITTPLGFPLLSSGGGGGGGGVSLGVPEEREDVGEVGEEAVVLGEFAFKQRSSSELPTILDSKSVWNRTVES